MFSIYIGLLEVAIAITLTNKTLIGNFLIGFQIRDFPIRLFREIIPSSDGKLCLKQRILLRLLDLLVIVPATLIVISILLKLRM